MTAFRLGTLAVLLGAVTLLGACAGAQDKQDTADEQGLGEWAFKQGYSNQGNGNTQGKQSTQQINARVQACQGDPKRIWDSSSLTCRMASPLEQAQKACSAQPNTHIWDFSIQSCRPVTSQDLAQRQCEQLGNIWAGNNCRSASPEEQCERLGRSWDFKSGVCR